MTRTKKQSRAQKAQRRKVILTAVAAFLAYAGIAYSIYGALMGEAPAAAAQGPDGQ